MTNEKWAPSFHTTHRSEEKRGLFTCQSATKLWAALYHYPHKERSLAPQVLPHSHHCPPPHNGLSRAAGPATQFQRTKTHTSPYPIRKRPVTEVAGEKLRPLGGDDGRPQKPVCKVWVRRQLRQWDMSNECAYSWQRSVIFYNGL